MTEAETLLEVKELKKHFPVRTGLLLRQTGTVKAVDGVSFQVKRGETLGLVGESGCGKSTLGRTIIRLYEATSGEVTFLGKPFSSQSGTELRRARRSMQMIFQDPYASLNPRHTVGQVIAEPFRIHGIGDARDRGERVRELMAKVGLNPDFVNRYPHEFSGGQRQRISIARAIALNPALVVADEPVSALDVSIQAQVLNLMKDLQKELGLAYLFISHDLGVVEHMCNTVAVMYLGRIVEIASRDALFSAPKHPYTQALLNAVPQVGTGRMQGRRALTGEVPSPLNPPPGCPFHTRCPKAMERCKVDVPTLRPVGSSPDAAHQVSCWLYAPTDAGTRIPGTQTQSAGTQYAQAPFPGAQAQ